VDATRQAVVDIRATIDWLNQQGFDRVGIVGTSLGSCYAFLASAHDERLGVNVFNHCSSYFADVVWTGLSTQHVRQGLEGQIDLETLRRVWDVVSPVNYIEQFARWHKKSKFIYATYDTTFLPGLSEDVVERIRAHAIDNELVVLPCGHYTLGETPFKFIDGYHICSFLKKWL
jgi:dienelactone hydrolase